MQFLFNLHSIVRWVLLGAGILIALKFAASWLRRDAYAGLDRGLTAAFSGVMDLQALLGSVYLIWNGLAGAGFPRYRLEHAFLMILAAIIAHLPARWQETKSPLRFRNTFFAFLGAILLIVASVGLLPGNRW